MRSIFAAFVLGASATVPSDGESGLDDFGDHPGFSHAMDVRTKRIDGFPVVFHYGQVRPSFEPPSAHPHRTTTPLRQGWHFRFDPENRGLADGWHSPEHSETTDWTEVSVPHCWDMMPGGRFGDWSDRSPANPPHYDGAAWYRLTFQATRDDTKRHRLEFLGVPHRVRVYLNGHEVAIHEGGGQPFSVEVTDRLTKGDNLLAVRIVRRPNHGPLAKDADKEPEELKQVHGAHPRAPDNWPYAGLIREVSLIEEPAVTVRKTQVRTRNRQLQAAVVITNHGTESRTVVVTLSTPATAKESTNQLELPPGKARVVRLGGLLNPDAANWTPDRPTLHRLRVRISDDGGTIDEWQGRFGIRDFSTKGMRLLLNDRPIFLKGIALYEETVERGAALRTEDHLALLKDCRDAGANFLRLHVIQRSPEVYRLADRLGFMVTAEWGGFWYREDAMRAQTRDERSLYQSHARCALWDLMNHPSVVLWCIHNESHQFCPEYEPFVRMGRKLVRDHDWHQRPVTWAAWHPHMGQPHFEHADAVGFNEYRGAMDPFEHLEPDMIRAARENPGKPLLILENGAWSHAGQRGSPKDKGTEDWQAGLLRRQHEVLTRHIPPLSGYTYWILRDYRSRKFYTRANDGSSGMGMYDPNGKPKLVRDVFRDLEWSR